MSTFALADTSPESASAAGLRYVSDTAPGITRRRAGRGFVFWDSQGKRITDVNELRRIKALAIPPAWTDVWICASSNGHMQATGRDAKGRKQYRYHNRWREVRDETKYNRLISFGEVLPTIRKQAACDISKRGLPREKLLGTVVQLLEKALIRVGNEQYARQNGSFGLTTLRDRHVNVSGATMRFRFIGKSGKKHSIDINDRRIARIIKRCQDIPGYELFQYEYEEGQYQSLCSSDVNAYLHELTGLEFSAKDFRTWAGTVAAATALKMLDPAPSARQAKKNIVRAVETVAELLGNTPAVCRKCYIHPEVLNSYTDGTMERLMAQRPVAVSRSPYALSAEENAVLSLLKRRANRRPERKKAAA